MSAGIDFSQPIPDVIKRLENEHRDLGAKLLEIEKACASDPKTAISLLQGIKAQVLHHSVEEEARVIRIIMKQLKSESKDSVHIMQEHRWVVEFLERRLRELPQIPNEQAQAEILNFTKDLASHFAEEEAVVFPLALRASRME